MSEKIKSRFRVYEIEHNGDESNVLDDLRRAGCTEIKVRSRDFDGEESIVVECVLPDDVQTMLDLRRRVPDLCL